MALEKELATYHSRLEELLPYEGKFVLIYGDEIAGVWDDYQDALQAGYEEFELDPFLVKRIEWVETIARFSRDIQLGSRMGEPPTQADWLRI